MAKKQKKSAARLNPLECDICEYKPGCGFGVVSDQLYRCGVTIRLEDCALYNGGKLREAARHG